jgi:hypothetical protein
MDMQHQASIIQHQTLHAKQVGKNYHLSKRRDGSCNLFDNFNPFTASFEL